ncbi:MAG: hypothetical protein HQL28_06045, partial [Candidatus Omnitrophica bacterium]|nr:hypothetical protein [Candidatus Omnitrophota bacterium]
VVDSSSGVIMAENSYVQYSKAPLIAVSNSVVNKVISVVPISGKAVAIADVYRNQISDNRQEWQFVPGQTRVVVPVGQDAKATNSKVQPGNTYAVDTLRDMPCNKPDNDKIEQAAAVKVDSVIADLAKMFKTNKGLDFGTSGLRALVTDMTDMEVYINTRGFIKFLKAEGEAQEGDFISIAGDRRDSTPRIMTAVAKAILDEGLQVDFCGLVPSPAVAIRGFSKGRASIMVTGSHIPEDRNGIKFNKKSGEVLKSDEKGILQNVARSRAETYAGMWGNPIFDEKGVFKTAPIDTTGKKLSDRLAENQEEVIEEYVARYKQAFPAGCFQGKTVAIYQHSAVGRDIMVRILEELGAKVIAPHGAVSITYTDEKGNVITEAVDLRSDVFVPVDTESVSNRTKAVIKCLADTYKPNVIMSTDGDSDRPLFADEKGDVLSGDKLGLLTTLHLKPQMVAIPISANKGVIDKLVAEGIKVVQTQVGSPHVIKAMNDWMAKPENAGKLCMTWEVNGGFLLGKDTPIPGGATIKALPTRDALVTLFSAFLYSNNYSSVSETIDKSIPHIYNTASVFKTWKEADGSAMESRKAFELMKMVKGSILPPLKTVWVNPADDSKKEPYVTSMTFKKNAQNTVTRRLVDANGILTFDVETKNVEEVYPAGMSDADYKMWMDVKELLSGVFTKERGFAEIEAIDVLDGVKVTFTNGEVSHLRPSGNAPEFRNYTTAATEKRAVEILKIGLGVIIPELVAKVQPQMSTAVAGTTVPGAIMANNLTPGMQNATPGQTNSTPVDEKLPPVEKRVLVKAGEVVPGDTKAFDHKVEILVDSEFDKVTGQVSELLTLNGASTTAPEIIGDRLMRLVVVQGIVVINGVRIDAMNNSQEVDLAAINYSASNTRIEIVNPKEAAVPAVIKFTYKVDKANGEKAAYIVAETVKKHYADIAKEKYAYIAPVEIYAKGGKGRKGDNCGTLFNIEDEEAFMDDAIGKGAFKVRAYDATYDVNASNIGTIIGAITKQIENAEAEGRVPVVAMTKEMFELLAKDAALEASFQKFFKDHKAWLAQPFSYKMKDLSSIAGKAWEFIREAEGSALLQTLLTPEKIRQAVANQGGVAEDVRLVVNQMAPEAVDAAALYLLLPYNVLLGKEIGDTDRKAIDELKAGIDLSDLRTVASFIISKLPMCMKIVATGVMQQLDNRRHVQWSA